jgi:hypothetical protein
LDEEMRNLVKGL